MYREPQRHRKLLQALAAVVLFGTPHSLDQEQWLQHANVLYTGKESPRKPPMSSEEASVLAAHSLHFSEAALAIPVISLYETRKTKVRKPGIFNQTQKVLVCGSVVSTH